MLAPTKYIILKISINIIIIMAHPQLFPCRLPDDYFFFFAIQNHKKKQNNKTTTTML